MLKWFAETAYKRSYLWSFRGAEISSALLGYLDIDAAHSWYTDVGRFFHLTFSPCESALIVALQ